MWWEQTSTLNPSSHSYSLGDSGDTVVFVFWVTHHHWLVSSKTVCGGQEPFQISVWIFFFNSENILVQISFEHLVRLARLGQLFSSSIILAWRQLPRAGRVSQSSEKLRKWHQQSPAMASVRKLIISPASLLACVMISHQSIQQVLKALFWGKGNKQVDFHWISVSSLLMRINIPKDPTHLRRMCPSLNPVATLSRSNNTGSKGGTAVGQHAVALAWPISGGSTLFLKISRDSLGSYLSLILNGQSGGLILGFYSCAHHFSYWLHTKFLSLSHFSLSSVSDNTS